eukprot:5817923-Pyramimonas_sp.AAC.1
MRLGCGAVCEARNSDESSVRAVTWTAANCLKSCSARAADCRDAVRAEPGACVHRPAGPGGRACFLGARAGSSGGCACYCME